MEKLTFENLFFSFVFQRDQNQISTYDLEESLQMSKLFLRKFFLKRTPDVAKILTCGNERLRSIHKR